MAVSANGSVATDSLDNHFARVSRFSRYNYVGHLLATASADVMLGWSLGN